MSSQTWWLTDAAQSRRDYPYTFYKPSDAVISKLGVGDQVKLIFEFDQADPDRPSGERMWVTITHIDGFRLKGELDNVPYHFNKLKLGDTVEFEGRHIIQTGIEEAEPSSIEKYLPRCFVTARILHDGEKAGYIYREQPEREDDSGWRIKAGDESEDYMDDPGNSFYVSLGAVLNRDDSFLHLLECAPDSAFTRNADTGEFELLQ